DILPKNLLHDLAQVFVQCIDRSKVCDGTPDCHSRSDELNCDCGPNAKMCPPGHCVPLGSSCDCTNCHQRNGDMEQDNTIVIVIGIICGCVVLLGIGLFIRHCMISNSRYPAGLVMFTPHTNGNCTVNVEIQSRADTTETVNHRKPSHHQSRKKGSIKGNSQGHTQFNLSIHPGGSRSGSNSWIPLHYSRGDCHSMKRPCIPGASKCSSLQGKIILPTTNPPPSPATIRSGSKSGERVYSSDSGRTHHRCKNAYKHRRSHRYPVHNPPPPTPCNTDTCDDVDRGNRGSNQPSTNSSLPHEPPPPYHHHPCCYHCCHQYPPQSRHLDGSSSSSYHCDDDDCSCGGDSIPSYPPSYNRHRRPWSRQLGHRTYLSSDINSDSDPFAPPPTPRSQYMSECCYTHGETTEADDPLDEEDEIPDDDVTDDVNDESRVPPAGTEEEEDGTDDDADTVLLNPRSSPSVTERSYRIYPPPSPATDSS
uniref:Uncharacterized protein n=1 Tax=Ciona savignyi TaxID=51511 RepID=H2Z5B3_CIOSA